MYVQTIWMQDIDLISCDLPLSHRNHSSGMSSRNGLCTLDLESAGPMQCWVHTGSRGSWSKPECAALWGSFSEQHRTWFSSGYFPTRSLLGNINFWGTSPFMTNILTLFGGILLPSLTMTLTSISIHCFTDKVCLFSQAL